VQIGIEWVPEQPLAYQLSGTVSGQVTLYPLGFSAQGPAPLQATVTMGLVGPMRLLPPGKPQ